MGQINISFTEEEFETFLATFFTAAHRRYIMSDKWKREIRNAVLERDGHKCMICGEDGTGEQNPLDIHHREYKNFGTGSQEEIDDCITLCRHCHNKIHTGKYSEKWLAKKRAFVDALMKDGETFKRYII